MKLDDDEKIFTIAHEISHYLLEVAITTSAAKRTPNGYPSLLDLEDKFRGSLIESIMLGGKIHAEVDLFAVAILKGLGLEANGGFSILTAAVKDFKKQLGRFAEGSLESSLPNPESIRLATLEQALH